MDAARGLLALVDAGLCVACGGPEPPHGLPRERRSTARIEAPQALRHRGLARRLGRLHCR